MDDPNQYFTNEVTKAVGANREPIALTELVGTFGKLAEAIASEDTSAPQSVVLAAIKLSALAQRGALDGFR